MYERVHHVQIVIHLLLMYLCTRYLGSSDWYYVCIWNSWLLVSPVHQIHWYL